MKTNIQFFLILIVCCCAFFVDLQVFYPDIMEMRNFITAREMLTEGNWWSTTLNLEPRLEKPPFPTWLTALSVKYLGSFDNLFIVRLPAALSATLMVFFFYGFCRELSSEKLLPFIGAIIMSTSLLIIQQARINSWDIYTHVFMLGSIWQFLMAIRRKRVLNIVLAIVLMALSIYSKGPVSLYALFVPFLIAFSFSGNFEQIKKYKTTIIVSLVIAIVIGFSWNIYMIVFQPEASDYVLNKEANSWMNRHVRPFYFYLHFAIYIGVWTIFMISSFFYKYASKRVNQFGNYKFLILWVLLSILFLSIIPTKKERYLLPAMVPMCLMVTFLVFSIWKAFKGYNENKWDKVVVNTSSLVIYSVSIATPLVLILFLDVQLDFRATLFAVLIGISGIVGIVLWKKNRIESNFITPVVIVCLFCLGLLPTAATIFYRNEGFKSLTEIQKIEKLKPYKFYSQNEELDLKIVYAAGKPVVPYSQIDLTNSKNFPIVIISYSPLHQIIDKSILKNLAIDSIGTYDLERKKLKYHGIVSLVEYKPAN